MKNIPAMKKGTVVFLSVVAIASVIGTLILIGSGSIRISDVFNALKNLSPRVINIMALPFVVVALLIGWAWFSKREERMWKDAVKKTRAARQQVTENKEPRST